MNRWRIPRLRFSLRTFLVLIYIIGALLGLAAHRIEKGKQRWAKIAELQRLGGGVGFHTDENQWLPGDDGPKSWWQTWNGVEQANNLCTVRIQKDATARRVLELIREFPDISTIDVAGQDADDRILDELVRHKNLMWLDLSESQISDAALARLASLPNLSALTLPHGCGDDGLAHLAKFPRLDRIFAAGAPITDDGVRHLAGMNSLHWLDLSNTRVSGDCGAYLSQLKNLRVLQLDRTQFDDVGISMIRSLSIHRLSLAGTNITDLGLQQLQGSDISELDLSDTYITGSGLRSLVNCHELESLNISETDVGDDDVPQLLLFPSHLMLKLHYLQLSTEGDELLAERKVKFEGLP